MARGADVVQVVEAAYRFEQGPAVWLRGVLEAVLPLVDEGLGAWAFFFDANTFLHGKSVWEHPVAFGLPDDWVEGLTRTLAVTAGDARILRRMLFATPCHSMSEVLARNAALLGSARRVIGSGLPGVRDAIGVAACDSSGTGVFIGAHAPHVVSLDRVRRARLGRIAAHVATAHRLRTSLERGGASGAARLVARAEAILGPQGRVQHAEGAATTREGLESLKQAAIRADRATRQLRRQDPDEALRSWEALVRGRWSLVGAFDDGGRRIFLAEPNEPAAPRSHRALTKRERQVAAYLLLGHSGKLIAYELGLAAGTISPLVTRIKRKLGADSAASLLRELERLALEGGLGPPGDARDP